jgi:hypothetical protein
VLGYTPYRAAETFTVATEEALGAGAVDTALGTFSSSERTILGPCELKGPGTDDLDAIMPGRNKSPVQQAWEYAIDAPGAKWVLVSNCAGIRLYAFGHGLAIEKAKLVGWTKGLRKGLDKQAGPHAGRPSDATLVHEIFRERRTRKLPLVKKRTEAKEIRAEIELRHPEHDPPAVKTIEGHLQKLAVNS